MGSRRWCLICFQYCLSCFSFLLVVILLAYSLGCPCLFAVPCAYLVLSMAIFVWFGDSCIKITPQRFCGHIGHYSHSKYMSGYKITVLQNVYVLLITQFQYTQIQDQGKLVLMISWLGHLGFTGVRSLCFGYRQVTGRGITLARR